jgi:hypothetical protein
VDLGSSDIVLNALNLTSVWKLFNIWLVLDLDFLSFSSVGPRMFRQDVFPFGILLLLPCMYRGLHTCGRVDNFVL